MTGSGLLRALFSTCRFRAVGDENYLRFWERGEPVIFALWHGRLLAGCYAQRGAGLVALVSQHKDGEYITRVIHRWRYATVRGSSTRGGSAALRDLAKSVRNGKSVVVTPDGPRGPRQKMKAGALLVAQLTGAPVIPVATGADRAWWIEGWDRFQIPKPWSQVTVAYGEPVSVPRRATADEIDRLTAEVEGRLDELVRFVDAPVQAEAGEHAPVG
jgi:lysophospholipid acyltransferase (LPLAT)-like uncharacterized protein